MAHTGKWCAAALADAILSSYGTNGRRPVGALPKDLYTVTTEDYIAATELLQRALSEVPARDLAPGEKVQRMLNKVCRSLGSTTFPTRAKRAFVLQGTGVMLSRMEVVTWWSGARHELKRAARPRSPPMRRRIFSAP